MKIFFYTVMSFFLFFSVVKADGFDVLSDEDESRYVEIFKLQQVSKYDETDEKIKEIEDKILLSYVYANRYLDKKYNVKIAELNDWLKNNEHHIYALKIYDLVVKKGGKPSILKPQKNKSNKKYGSSCHVVDTVEPLDMLYKLKVSGGAKKTLLNKIIRSLSKGNTLNAKDYFESENARSLFSRIERDNIAVALAFAYYIDGQDDMALKYVNQAMERSGKQVPLGYWVNGLINFRRQNYEESYVAFKNFVKSDIHYDGLVSAGAFFASRSALKTKRYSEVNDFLKIASKNRLSFYGVMAKRALGHEKSIEDDTKKLGRIKAEDSYDVPEAREILALLEISQNELAYDQFKHLYYYGNDDMRELLVMMANESGHASLLSRINQEDKMISEEDMNYYPVPNWRPKNGWKVDKALVYAFVRQESCFNKKARNGSGATGLMQIMPGTAAIIAKDMKIRNWSRSRLLDPEENVTIGQRYIEKLLKEPNVENNLFFTAIAYNAGPGNLRRLQNIANYNGDPLLFVEGVPSKEGRDFIKKVMSNFWVYRSLLNKSNPSLEDVVSGSWPIYDNSEDE